MIGWGLDAGGAGLGGDRAVLRRGLGGGSDVGWAESRWELDWDWSGIEPGSSGVWAETG